jgi:hypothetical protein
LTELEKFEALLFQGTLTAFRTLPLDDLARHLESIQGMELPEEIAAFPIAVLQTVIAEKQTQRALN